MSVAAIQGVALLSGFKEMASLLPALAVQLGVIKSEEAAIAGFEELSLFAQIKKIALKAIEIVQTAILAIEYDEDTKALLKDVKKADALSGARGNSFMQQSVARGMQAAGENGGGANMAFMGMGMNAAGGMMGAMQQPNTGSTYQPNFGAQAQPEQPQAAPAEDPYAKLAEMKKLLDSGVISQEDFDKAKAQILGI